MLRNSSRFLSILLILLTFSGKSRGQQLWSGVLAPTRATNWANAGVPGGVPSASWTQCTTPACSAVTSAGTSATAAQILSALKSASANTYVQLGAGTYNVNTGICPSGLNNVELRGAGAGSTFLKFTGSTSCMYGGTSTLLGFQSTDSTYAGGVSLAYNVSAPAQGSNTIVVPGGLAGATITPGVTLANIDQCNTGRTGSTCTGSTIDNGQYFNCGDQYTGTSGGEAVGCGLQGEDGSFARAERFQVETTLITGCTPSCTSSGSVTLTLKDPIIHPNWSSSATPQVWFVQSIQNVGFKDFSMDGTNASSSISGITFNNAANVWVQGVAITNVNYIGIWSVLVSHGSFIDNYLYNIGQHISCNNNACDPWGMKDGSGEFNLFQNNIVQDVRVCISTGEGPATGDVVGYNLCIYAEDGSDYVWPQFWQHANGDDFDLYEGNVATLMNEDGVHGTHEMITAFRNLFTGWESCANANCGGLVKNAGMNGVTILAYNRYTNIVGNVLGPVAITPTQYQLEPSEYYTGLATPYNLGGGNSSASPAIPYDPLVASTLMRWGNFDFFTNAAMFCTGSGLPSAACTEDERAGAATAYPGLSSPTTSLPASFYLSSAPNWWGAISFPAIGPDVTGGNLSNCTGTLNTKGQYAGLPALASSQCTGTALASSNSWAGHVNAIPSLACYLNFMHGPPDGVTSAALIFNRTSCYSSSGNSTQPPPPLNLTGTLVL